MTVNILEVFILKKYSIYIEKCKIPKNNLIKKIKTYIFLNF